MSSFLVTGSTFGDAHPPKIYHTITPEIIYGPLSFFIKSISMQVMQQFKSDHKRVTFKCVCGHFFKGPLSNMFTFHLLHITGLTLLTLPACHNMKSPFQFTQTCTASKGLSTRPENKFSQQQQQQHINTTE